MALAPVTSTGTCRITFRGMDAVDAARVEVNAWLAKLAPLAAGLRSSHVAIAVTDERREGRLYHVSMELDLPGGAVSVEHGHPRNAPHEDIYVAIRNGFRAARQQLEHVRAMPPCSAHDAAQGLPGEPV